MKRILLSLIILSLLLPNIVSAQSASKSGSTKVRATVQGFLLNISGFHSPFASIVLTRKEGSFLSSTTADENGNFSFSGISITAGFDGFCLRAVDFKKIGESEACIDIEAGPSDVTRTNIFLPPSIGISKKIITEGESVQIFGYTMPNAKVLLDRDGIIIEMLANSKGFYEYQFDNVAAGIYAFKSTAELNDEPSLPPTKSVLLEAVVKGAIGIASVPEKKEGLSLFFLIPLLILLGMLAFLTWKFKLIPMIFDRPDKKTRMHHDWFLINPKELSVGLDIDKYIDSLKKLLRIAKK